ncbi:MAG: hypothetical protein U9O94_04250 [Nanoarchaeota archaeon]|nr:hypothetical protein [Nanoarchaeota archaeon]
MLTDLIKDYKNPAVTLTKRAWETFDVMFIPTSYIRYFSRKDHLGGPNEVMIYNFLILAETVRIVVGYGPLLENML